MKFLLKKKTCLTIITTISILFFLKTGYCSDLGIMFPPEFTSINITSDAKTLVAETKYINFYPGTNEIYLSYPGVNIVPDSFFIQFLDAPSTIELIQTSNIYNASPEFRWIVHSQEQGVEPVKIFYLVEGLKISYSYIVHGEENKNCAAVQGMLALANHTGEEFMDVRIVERENRAWRTNLKAGEEKKLFFADTFSLPLQTIYLSDYQNYGEKIIFQYQLTNTTEDVLMPGKIIFYERRQDDSFAFVGENRLDLMNAGEKTNIAIGEVQDIKIERKLIEFSRTNIRYNDAGNIEIYDTNEKYEINLKNQKQEKITLMLREYIPDTWEIVESKPFDCIQEDAQHIIFNVEMMPGENIRISYRVQRKNLLPYQPIRSLVP